MSATVTPLSRFQQKCKHGKTYRHPLWNGPFGPPMSQIVEWCPGPSLVVSVPDEQTDEAQR